MRFKGVKFSWGSVLLGWHYGRNPVSGQRFLHIGLFPFVGLDFDFPPYSNDVAKQILRDAEQAARVWGGPTQQVHGTVGGNVTQVRNVSGDVRL